MSTDVTKIDYWQIRAIRELEDVFIRLYKEKASITAKAARTGNTGSSSTIVQLNLIVRDSFTEACNVTGQIFRDAGLEGNFSEEELLESYKKIMVVFREKLEENLGEAYIQRHKSLNIRPTWEEFSNWMHHEVDLMGTKHIKSIFAHETPGIKELKRTTPDNWKDIFSRADEDSLHEIVDGKLVRASNVIISRAKSEIRRREKLVTIATVNRPKDQKFAILDAPKLLEEDLLKAQTVLGLACLFLDLDNFKFLNTTYSEEVVDIQLLPIFQSFINEIVRDNGFAYARGGDEIAILLPNCSLPMSKAFAESLQEHLSKQNFRVNDDYLQLTLSVGIAHVNANQDASELIKKANLAMRRAKDMGKNRVEIYINNHAPTH